MTTSAENPQREARAEAFRELRASSHAQIERETTERVKTDPQPNDEETNAGAFPEMLEPQVRDAVFEMRKKGYATESSGFFGKTGEVQSIDGYFEIDPKTELALRDMGVQVSRNEGHGPKYAFLRFSPDEPSLEKIKAKWDEVAKLLPDRGQQAEPSVSGHAEEFIRQYAPERTDILQRIAELREQHDKETEEAMAKKEAEASEPRHETRGAGRNLYDIEEVDGMFEAVLPGLFDKKREVIVGITRESFATREEAELAVRQSREDARMSFERASLEKTYAKYIFRIDETKDGKFRVMLPGLLDSKTGRYLGTTYEEFNTWDQAKEYFLQARESQEQLTQAPLLEIQTGEHEKIVFSELDAFNPRVTPSEQPHDIPASVEQYLMGRGRLDGSEPSAFTYRETIKEKGWERKLFSFVSSYLAKAGVGTAEDLGIEHLDALTPRQAVELATCVVIDLTKYKQSDARERQGDIPLKPEPTKADQSTAQQLLQEGLRKKDDPDWEGNGVCRNFASSVKAVFEALKANQTRFSQLRDTHCLYEGGFEEYKPKRQKWGTYESRKTGHAWNTFVTISREGTAEATIIDATWAKRNLDTQEIEGLDYTLTRMEPVVHAIGQNLPESAPDKKEQVQHLLSYYLLKIEEADERQEGEKQFFTTRAIELMKKQGVPGELPPPLVEAISQEYQKLAADADISEVETIFNISKSNPAVGFQGVLKGYLKDKRLTDYHAAALIFRNDDLQRATFEELKFREDFEDLLKKSPQFRIRMREVLPQLFVDFSPETKPEDAAELQELMRRSQGLRAFGYIIDPNKPSAEKIRVVLERARETLRASNPKKYDAMAAHLDDYQLVKRYDEIDRALRA